MGFFSNEEFIRYKKCTQPVYQTPASIQQMLDIAGVHENGIFEIEPNNGAGKKRRKFDRVYSFSDLNYVDQDKQQKDGILFQLRKFLNSMDTDFKITIQCEPRDVTNFQKSLLQDENKSEYPELARYNNEMIKKSLEKGQENVRKQRYLTVSANCRSIEEAEGWFDTFEHTALPIFYAMGSELVPLNAVQRFQKIRNYFFTDDGEESFILPFQDMVQAGRDFRNSILPHSVRNHKSYMEFDEECMRILFAAVLPTRLNEEKLIFELTDFPFYTCLTIDTAYIPREVLRGKISNTNFYNENAIGQEVQANASMGNFYSEPSYAKKKKQANLKKYMDQIEEDDENGFYVGILLAVRGANKEELDANTAEVRRRCRKHSIQIVSYYDQQIQALNTLLPIGARRVNNMRSVLTSSYLAFQPFYSWDLIQPGGTWYGINKKTRNPIIGNRKTLKNSNGVIFGHTGSGKSMLLKITEIGQTLINSTDDIFLIDPQNEMKGITQRFRGQYFDLSDPDLRLNPLEIPESLLQKNAKGREEYILSQLQYMEAFLYSIMTGIRPNGIHKSLIYRCVEELYQNTFSKKKPISPVLSDLEAIFQKQREPEARDLYTQTLQPLLTSLTEYYGFDFTNASDALKGCVLSFGNRDGKYVVSLKRYFDGTTSASTDREIIERAYDAMIARRPNVSRWSYEKADCLAQLDGTLDIYAPSENGAGGIDWSWKKSIGAGESGNAAVQAALNAVGSGYSQSRRDDPGWYDCSSLVYRSYAAAGITYLNGMDAASEAECLVNKGMTVSYGELQPGDLIFYSYSANGKYRNISHVAIYLGNGEMVHAADESRGVCKQAMSQSNLSPQLYCRPQ